MKNIFAFFLLLTIALLSSCGVEDIDISSPSMQVLDFTPTPASGEVCGATQDTVFHLKGGDLLSFELLFRDDAQLSQYKIDIHSNFDCHGHGTGAAPGVSIPDIANQTEDWSLLDIGELTGTQQVLERSLNAPDNVTAGSYHFQIQVLDQSGNDNPLANFYSLSIKNPNDTVAPQVQLITPGNTHDITIARGSDLNLQGVVTDNLSLSDGGNGVLFLSYTNLNTNNTFLSNAVFPFDVSVNKEYAFDFGFTIPVTIQPGAYQFFLGATDGVRNNAEGVTLTVMVLD